jgi:hypothetical protein
MTWTVPPEDRASGRRRVVPAGPVGPRLRRHDDELRLEGPLHRRQKLCVVVGCTPPSVSGAPCFEGVAPADSGCGRFVQSQFVCW